MLSFDISSDSKEIATRLFADDLTTGPLDDIFEAARRMSPEPEPNSEEAQQRLDQCHGGVRRAGILGLLCAYRAGAILSEIKKTINHGDWGGWVEEHCSFGLRSAQDYAYLFHGWELLRQALAAEPCEQERLCLGRAIALIRRRRRSGRVTATQENGICAAPTTEPQHRLVIRQLANLQAAGRALVEAASQPPIAADNALKEIGRELQTYCSQASAKLSEAIAQLTGPTANTSGTLGTTEGKVKVLKERPPIMLVQDESGRLDIAIELPVDNDQDLAAAAAACPKTEPSRYCVENQIPRPEPVPGQLSVVDPRQPREGVTRSPNSNLIAAGRPSQTSEPLVEPGLPNSNVNRTRRGGMRLVQEPR